MNGVAGAELPFCYVTTVGRRTGRPHTVELWFAADGRTLYLLAGSHRCDWVRNLEANHHVGVRLAGQHYPAVARLVESGTDEDRVARRLILAKYEKPGQHDLERWGRTGLAVALDLVDQSRQ